MSRIILLSFLFIFSAVATVTADTVSYDYDALGRLIEADYGNSKVVKYTYDPAGNRTSHVVTGTGLSADPGTGTGGVVVLPISGFIVLPLPAKGSVVGN